MRLIKEHKYIAWKQHDLVGLIFRAGLLIVLVLIFRFFYVPIDVKKDNLIAAKTDSLLVSVIIAFIAIFKI